MLKTGDTQVNRTISIPRFRLSVFSDLLSRRWWWVTLVVLMGMGVLARLGVWQLDRLEQRKARNAILIQQLSLPPLALLDEPLPENLAELKNRQANARGEFDFSRQVVLLHQNRMNSPGFHLITPLVLEGTSQAVLVDRGWLPIDQADPENWPLYDEPGPVSVTGFIQLSQTLPATAGDDVQRIPPEPLSEWYRVDVEAIQAQMPYELLPIYILQLPPDESDADLPYQVETEFDLSNGPHLGYAIQWFLFALILGVTYVSYVNKKETSQLRASDASHKS